MSIPFIPNQKNLSINLSDGFSITVPNDITEISTFTYLEQETWFENDKNILNDILPDNFKAVDIGANYGFYSLFMANLDKGNSKIFSIEPCLNTMTCFKQSIKENNFNNITPLQIGLSDTKSEAFLSIQESSELNEVVYETQLQGQFEKIQLDSLDNLYKQYDLKGCHFIKLDAEGHEEKVLKGAKIFFENESPIVMFEIRHGADYNFKLIDLFKSLNYQIFELDYLLNKLKKFNQEKIDPLLLNVFAVPKGLISQLKSDNLVIDFIDFQKLDSNYLNDFFLKKKSYQLLGFNTNIMEHTKVTLPKYWNALNMFIASQNSEINHNFRHLYLKQSYEDLKSIASESPSIAPTLSLIRVAIEYRDINLALELSQYFLKQIEDKQILNVESIFLSLDKQYENLTEINAKWLEEQLVYIQETHSGYSSIFEGDASFIRTSKLISFQNEKAIILRKNILCNFGRKNPKLQKLKENLKNNLNNHLWRKVLD
ncbi:MAG: hypothetical protein COB02_09860 [Candidatus Cloacimonadota bacterium]|nr:MAG: hypothetical protein COB02_09860 [Candidatus Cloacimonadota bacterium]